MCVQTDDKNYNESTSFLQRTYVKKKFKFKKKKTFLYMLFEAICVCILQSHSARTRFVHIQTTVERERILNIIARFQSEMCVFLLLFFTQFPVSLDA